MATPTFPAIANLPDTTTPVLATGLFDAGPSDKLATADVYNLKSSLTGEENPITSIQEINVDLSLDALGVRLDGAPAKDFLSKLETPGNSFDEAMLTSRMGGVDGENKSLFGQLDDSLKKNALLATFKDKANFISTSINGVSSSVDAKNIGQIRALGGFINKYTGTKVFSGNDKGAISGMLGSVINTSSDLGVSGVFKTISDTITDNGIIGRVTRGVLPIVLKNSDSKLLREIATSKAVGFINILSPGFTQSFTKGFTYRGNRGQTLNSFEDIFHSFEKVDSQWDTLSRGNEGNSALNLLTLVSGSKDFQRIVMTGVKYWATEIKNGKTAPINVDPMYALATAFSPTTVSQAVRRDFPQVALLNSYNTRLPTRSGLTSGQRSLNNSNVIDPRIIKSSLAGFLGL